MAALRRIVLCAPMNMVTVIIPTTNNRDLLRRCLDSLQGQTVPCRVLVVDNGSTDGTLQMLRDGTAARRQNLDGIRLAAKQGFAAAVNSGIERSGGGLVALLNDDTEAGRDWIEEGCEAMREHPEYAFFACRILRHADPSILDSAGDGYDRRGIPFKRGRGRTADAYSTPEPVLCAGGAAAFYRREVFERIGLFDESYFMYLEDVEWSLRAQLHGYRCLYLPDAVVTHREAASDAWLRQHQGHSSGALYSPARVYWITRNRWLLMVTYQPAGNLPWLAAAWARSLAGHALRHGFLGSFLRGLAAGIRATPGALAKRRALEKTRVLSAREFNVLLEKSGREAP